jgi:hypothetical protein
MKAEFEYFLKDRMMPDIKVYIKNGLSTNIQGHASVQLKKLLNNEPRKNIFDWTPS